MIAHPAPRARLAYAAPIRTRAREVPRSEVRGCDVKDQVVLVGGDPGGVRVRRVRVCRAATRASPMLTDANEIGPEATWRIMIYLPARDYGAGICGAV